VDEGNGPPFVPRSTRSRAVRDGSAIHLIGDLYAVSGGQLSHRFDANAYLMLGRDIVLFDCGSPLGAPDLERNLAWLGISLGDVSAVYATHGHYDHVGGAAALAAAGVPVYVHHGDLAAVAAAGTDRTAAYLYGEAFPVGVRPEPLAVAPFQVCGATVQVVETPGHSPGSVSFVFSQAAQRLVIAGDAVWGCYEPARLGSDLDVWRRSLDTLIAHEPDLLLTGHGDPEPASDATQKLQSARAQFGSALNPWMQFPCQALGGG